MSYPVRMNWVDSSELTTEPLKVAFVVPKRSFNKAVDRNTLKRKMKEAFRLNQTNLLNALTESDQKFSMLFIYQAKNKMSFHQIEKAMQKGIKKMMSLHDLA